MNLKEILETANEELEKAHNALNDHEAAVHLTAHFALQYRKSNFKTPPDVTPAGTPVGARQVTLEHTDLVAKAA